MNEQSNGSIRQVRVLLRPSQVKNARGDGLDTIWAARCLEYDIVAQGANEDEALYSFQRIFCKYQLLSHERGRDLIVALPKAPPHVFAAFEAAEPPTRRFSVESKAPPFIANHVPRPPANGTSNVGSPKCDPMIAPSLIIKVARAAAD